MKNLITKLIVTLLLLGFASCASLTTTKTKTVYIKSNKEVKVLYNGEFVGQGKFVPFQAHNRMSDKLVTVIDVETNQERVFGLQYGVNADILANGAWFAFPVIGWIGLIGFIADFKTKSYVSLEEVDYYIEWKKEKKEYNFN